MKFVYHDVWVATFIDQEAPAGCDPLSVGERAFIRDTPIEVVAEAIKGDEEGEITSLVKRAIGILVYVAEVDEG